MKQGQSPALLVLLLVLLVLLVQLLLLVAFYLQLWQHEQHYGARVSAQAVAEPAANSYTGSCFSSNLPQHSSSVSLVTAIMSVACSSGSSI
jgi:flagellar basal body-associated protein FliL